MTVFNRKGHHVAGGKVEKLDEYMGVKIKKVFTIDQRGVAAFTSSFSAACKAAIGKYDVVHIHAEGPAFFSFIPRWFGKRVVVTVHGLDWARAKWGRFASWYIKTGEKNAVKYADEIVETLNYIKKFCESICDSKQCHPIIVDNYNYNKTVESLFDGICSIEYVGIEDGRQIYKLQWSGIQVLYCKYGENAGFARANNLGAAISNHIYHDKYYLFSNNDITCKEPFDITKFDEIFERHPEIAIIGPCVETPNGVYQSPCKKISVFRHLFFTYWVYSIPFVKTKGDLDYTWESKVCYWVSGCFMVVKAAYFNQVKGFDENTFLYAEEMILSERLAQIGKGCYFYDEYKIVHEGGHSTKKSNTNIQIMKIRFDSLCYFYYTYRNIPRIIINMQS